MRNDERTLIELTQRWERNQRLREVAGIPDPDEEAETPEALTRRELRRMLLKDRTPKGDQK